MIYVYATLDMKKQQTEWPLTHIGAGVRIWKHDAEMRKERTDTIHGWVHSLEIEVVNDAGEPREAYVEWEATKRIYKCSVGTDPGYDAAYGIGPQLVTEDVTEASWFILHGLRGWKWDPEEWKQYKARSQK